jgi:hypothetical protein
MDEIVIVREWDSDVFHRRVRELEAVGYVACHETYHITPEVDPQTGRIIHLHTIEMHKAESADRFRAKDDRF